MAEVVPPTVAPAPATMEIDPPATQPKQMNNWWLKCIDALDVKVKPTDTTTYLWESTVALYEVLGICLTLVGIKDGKFIAWFDSEKDFPNRKLPRFSKTIVDSNNLKTKDGKLTFRTGLKDYITENPKSLGENKVPYLNTDGKCVVVTLDTHVAVREVLSELNKFLGTAKNIPDIDKVYELCTRFKADNYGKPNGLLRKANNDTISPLGLKGAGLSNKQKKSFVRSVGPIHLMRNIQSCSSKANKVVPGNKGKRKATGTTPDIVKAEKAKRTSFNALEKATTGPAGRAYVKYMRANGFSLPVASELLGYMTVTKYYVDRGFIRLAQLAGAGDSDEEYWVKYNEAQIAGTVKAVHPSTFCITATDAVAEDLEVTSWFFGKYKIKKRGEIDLTQKISLATVVETLPRLTFLPRFPTKHEVSSSSVKPVIPTFRVQRKNTDNQEALAMFAESSSVDLASIRQLAQEELKRPSPIWMETHKVKSWVAGTNKFSPEEESECPVDGDGSQRLYR